MTKPFSSSMSQGIAVVSLTLGSALGAAHAQQIGRTDLAAPGAMVSTCSGIASGSDVIEAGGLLNFVGSRFSCVAAATASAGSIVASSSAYTEPLIDHADAAAQAALGEIKLSSGFRANSNLPGYAGGFANGGWADMLTLQPGQAAQLGQTAIFSFQLHVSGSLNALPQGNSSTSLMLTAYRNDVSVDQIGGSGHLVVGGQGQGGFPYSQTIDQTYTFSTPVTLGTAFELGIFGLARSGATSRGPDWWSEASNDFGHTITWLGVSSVTLGGQAVAYTLESASGVDWTSPYVAAVPEPSSALLLLGAGALIAWRQALAQRPG